MKIFPMVVDLSHWDPADDYRAVKDAGIVGVIYKATEGTGYTDDTYATQRRSAREAGLLWGGYHFADGSNVNKQIDNFVNFCSPDEDELFCLDWEDNDGNVMSAANAKTWITEVEKELGRPGECVIYSGNTAKDLINGRDSFFGARRLWLCHYTSGTPTWQESWDVYWLWQYTDGESGPSPHSIDGIGKCDINSYDQDGGAAQLTQEWASGGNEPGPEPTPPPDPTPIDRPDLSKGDSGPDVVYLQAQLNSDNDASLVTDGDFGSATDSAVRNYQGSRRLSVDGIVGPQTWEALETDAPPYTPPELPPPMSQAQIDAVVAIAGNSAIARFDWDERGRAPAGYTKGVAVTFANVYRQFLIGYSPALEMALANTHDSNTDVLAWEAGRFKSAGLPIDTDGPDTLRSLWAYLLGLGMRESSGEYCCGRDQSASNTSSNTCEAGAWQTSYDAHPCSKNWDVLFNAYNAGGGNNPQGFVEVFREDVTCSSSNWQNYGSGNGLRHQDMSKNQPAYAAEVCAITLRNLRSHFGPVNNRAVEIRPEAADMLKRVQDYIDEAGVVVA